MKNVFETAGQFKGGIEDFGKHKEGECFKLYSTIAGASNTWVFCLDDVQKKIALMKNIKEIRILRQHDQGIIVMPKENKEPDEETMDELMNKKNENLILEKPSPTGVVDGHWKLLQDWTKCNLKCGGGNSTLHRMCIPPINGGKPCDGSPIIIRKCNTQDCPNSLTATRLVNVTDKKITEEVKKVVVKVLPFSDRPQRYEVIFYFRNV